jgi:hypothetical protein
MDRSNSSTARPSYDLIEILQLVTGNEQVRFVPNLVIEDLIEELQRLYEIEAGLEDLPQLAAGDTFVALGDGRNSYMGNILEDGTLYVASEIADHKETLYSEDEEETAESDESLVDDHEESNSLLQDIKRLREEGVPMSEWLVVDRQ